MSRSEYNDDCEQWALICWRGAVNSAMKGARGQAFLNELVQALDALPEKRLIADELEEANGAVCAIGAVGKARGIDMSNLDPEEPDRVASTFGIAPAMAREIVYMNDEGGSHKQTPEERWVRMRKWAVDEIWHARGCIANPRGLHKSARMMNFPIWRTVIDDAEV